MTQPDLGFCFDQLAEQMLLKRSTADNIADLQAELNQLDLQDAARQEDQTMQDADEMKNKD